MTDTFPPAFVARALVSAKAGNHTEAQRALARLIALQPAWRDHPRRELAKIFEAPWVVDRLAGDLAALGLGEPPADVTGAAAGLGGQDGSSPLGPSAPPR